MRLTEAMKEAEIELAKEQENPIHTMMISRKALIKLLRTARQFYKINQIVKFGKVFDVPSPPPTNEVKNG